MSSPCGNETGTSGTRTVIVGWKRARVMDDVLAPVYLTARCLLVIAMHYQKFVSHGKWLLPSMIHWRVGSYANLACGYAKPVETNKRPQEKVCLVWRADVRACRAQNSISIPRPSKVRGYARCGLTDPHIILCYPSYLKPLKSRRVTVSKRGF